MWYDEYSLTIGDRLRHSIVKGLQTSRFGVVIFSKHFFRKKWPQLELDGLVTLEEDRRKVILPVWHGVSFDEVAAFSPILADRIAISSELGIQTVADKIEQVLRNEESHNHDLNQSSSVTPKDHAPTSTNRKAVLLWGLVIASMVTGLLFLQSFNKRGPKESDLSWSLISDGEIMGRVTQYGGGGKNFSGIAYRYDEVEFQVTNTSKKDLQLSALAFWATANDSVIASGNTRIEREISKIQPGQSELFLESIPIHRVDEHPEFNRFLLDYRLEAGDSHIADFGAIALYLLYVNEVGKRDSIQLSNRLLNNIEIPLEF